LIYALLYLIKNTRHFINLFYNFLLSVDFVLLIFPVKLFFLGSAIIFTHFVLKVELYNIRIYTFYMHSIYMFICATGFVTSTTLKHRDFG